MGVQKSVLREVIYTSLAPRPSHLCGSRVIHYMTLLDGRRDGLWVKGHTLHDPIGRKEGGSGNKASHTQCANLVPNCALYIYYNVYTFVACK